MKDNPENIPSISICICSVCEAMYNARDVVHIQSLKEKGLSTMMPLPCGHPAQSIVFSASLIRRALLAEDLLEWMDRNRMLDTKFQEYLFCEELEGLSIRDIMKNEGKKWE